VLALTGQTVLSNRLEINLTQVWNIDDRED